LNRAPHCGIFDRRDKRRDCGLRPRFQPVGLTGRRLGLYRPEGRAYRPEGRPYGSERKWPLMDGNYLGFIFMPALQGFRTGSVKGETHNE